MLAVSVSALAGEALPQDFDELTAQVLANPADAQLNLRYAHVAEERGELRLALAAYERVLINEPENEEARRGYARIRRALEPTYTTTRLEFGAQWDSNPRNVSGPGEEEAWSVFARAALVDERRLGARRWRSNVNFDGEVTPDINELNYGFLGAQAGPMVDLAPNLVAIPALGVGASTLDGDFYFGDVNLGVTLEGQASGVSYWTRLRGGWRDYGEDFTADEGAYAELAGGLTAPHVFSDHGSVSVVPWVRWSDVEGSTFDFFFDEIAPGQFVEYGLEAAYNYRFNDHLGASIGALARDRRFTETVIFGEKRRDTYVAPQASLMIYNALPCTCVVKLTYRHRDNRSNDDAFDFDAEQARLSVTAHF